MKTSEEHALALLSLRGPAQVSVPPESQEAPLARIVNRTTADTTYLIRKNRVCRFFLVSFLLMRFM